MNDLKSTIQYSDFEKMDIRVATILSAEAVEGSEKLIKLVLDVGDGQERVILTGMAKWYSPKDFVGMQTLIIANLEPRKMMGLESQGMLLSIGTDFSKRPVFIVPKEKVENGQGVC